MINTVVVIILGAGMFLLRRRTKRLQQRLDAHVHLSQLSTTDGDKDGYGPDLRVIPGTTAVAAAANWLSRQLHKHPAAAVGLASGTIAAVTTVLIIADDPTHQPAQAQPPTITAPLPTSTSPTPPNVLPTGQPGTPTPKRSTTSPPSIATTSTPAPSTTLSVGVTTTTPEIHTNATLTIAAARSTTTPLTSPRRLARRCDMDLSTAPAEQRICRTYPIGISP